MIVRILSRGKSFKGLATYLTRDPNAKTDERVAWTHTLNCANDHVHSAVSEMVWTARDAELLKQEAGVRAGGRATEHTVKHLSLNWAPEDNPTREHMIATTEDFLRHMKWHEHQAVIVAHQDKEYKHVHVMLNSVHPETGLKLDDNFDHRRAQAWALQYEKEQGRIYCEQRLKEPDQRESAPPRNIWMAFQENENEFARAEKILRENEPIFSENRKNDEWIKLKEIQRTERMEFFSQGKSEFSELRLSIYREIREEFRGRWADYFAAQKNRVDPETLVALKAELVADQKAVLETRRDAACQELRNSRDQHYRTLLDEQRQARADLRERQVAGLENATYLEEIAGKVSGRRINAGFRDAANETAMSSRNTDRAAETSNVREESRDNAPTINSSGDDSGVQLRVGFSVGSLFEALFCNLVNLG